MVALRNNKCTIFYKTVVNFTITFSLERKISTCHGFNMLIVEFYFDILITVTRPNVNHKK